MVVPQISRGDESVAPDWKTVEPLLSENCYRCHGGEKTKGKIDLKVLAEDPKFREEFELWNRVHETVESGEMPPDEDDALKPEQQHKITGWITDELHTLAAEFSGDPGPVTMRRLTNAEYDRTIRDLTGHDFELAKEFQSEAGGGEGFSNIGDVMFLSPSSIEKYLSAARQLADHATIMPGTGIAFHVNRIATLYRNEIKDRIILPIESLGSTHRVRIHDGKHRFSAAVLRGDEFVDTGVGEEECGEILKLFPSAIKLAET